MINKQMQMLDEAIHDYLEWMKSHGYSHKTWMIYKQGLDNFLAFIEHKDITCNDIFTLDTIETFLKETGRTHTSAAAIRGLCGYLFQQKRIQTPIQKQL